MQISPAAGAMKEAKRRTQNNGHYIRQQLSLKVRERCLNAASRKAPATFSFRFTFGDTLFLPINQADNAKETESRQAFPLSWLQKEVGRWDAGA